MIILTKAFFYSESWLFKKFNFFYFQSFFTTLSASNPEDEQKLLLKERERLERLDDNREGKVSSKMPAVSAARAARRNASQKKKQAQDRRNAMSQMSHRKSLVRGIISVASGEVNLCSFQNKIFILKNKKIVLNTNETFSDHSSKRAGWAKFDVSNVYHRQNEILDFALDQKTRFLLTFLILKI